MAQKDVPVAHYKWAVWKTNNLKGKMDDPNLKRVGVSANYAYQAKIFHF